MGVDNSGGQSIRMPRTLLARTVGRISSEGVELEELESDSYREGVFWGVEDRFDVEDESEGREADDVIGGSLEVVDEVLRGIVGKGAPALLALGEKRWIVMVAIIEKWERAIRGDKEVEDKRSTNSGAAAEQRLSPQNRIGPNNN